MALMALRCGQSAVRCKYDITHKVLSVKLFLKLLFVG